MLRRKYQEFVEEWKIIEQNLLEQGFSKYAISKIISEEFNDPLKVVKNYLHMIYCNEYSKNYYKELEHEEKQKIKKETLNHLMELSQKRGSNAILFERVEPIWKDPI